MSDFTWYSRLCIWTGAAILVLESVTGRGLGAVTALATIGCALGLLGFTGGLVWDAQPRVLAQETASADDRLTSDDRAEATALPPPAAARADAIGALKPSAPLESIAPDPVPDPVRRAVSGQGATAQDVVDGGALVGMPCLVCQEPLRAGQTAAQCRACTGAHHATCWMGNHFHCGREGCAGHGGLHVPEESTELPFGSPSKP